MKTTSQHGRQTAIASLVFVLLLSSCSSNAVTPSVAQQFHSLKVGDSFTYQEYTTDTSGVKDPGSDTTIAALVVGTAMTYAGKTNVAEIVKGSDTVYLADAKDSSFALLQSAIGISTGITIPSMWIPFDPSVIPRTIYDSTQNGKIAGMPAKIHSTIEVTYLGKGPARAGTSTLTVYHFLKTASVVVTVYGQDYITTVTVSNDYAPAIGYLALHNSKTISNTDSSPISSGYAYSILQDFKLQ